MVSKFQDDPTVNESGIVVLLGQVWVYARKEKAQCERHFFHHKHYLKHPNGECVKISSEPRVQISRRSNDYESKIVILVREV